MCFHQGRALLSRLQGLKAKGIQLKISSGMIDSTELDTLEKKKSQRQLSVYSLSKIAAAYLSLQIIDCTPFCSAHFGSVVPVTCLCFILICFLTISSVPLSLSAADFL